MRRWLSFALFRLSLWARIQVIRNPGVQWAAANNYGPLTAALKDPS